MHKKFSKPVLIIPAAGLSTRSNNTIPKWIFKNNIGKTMLEKVIEGLNLNDFSEKYLVVKKEHFDIYENFLKTIPLQIIVLQEITKSCPETIYNALKVIKRNCFMVIKDCDCLAKFNILNENFVIGMTANWKEPDKSFVIEQNNIIAEIVEKKIASNKACLGVYGMHSENFLKSYSQIKNVGKEIYFSDIITNMIKEGQKFMFVECQDYIDWGNLTQWEKNKDLE